jgi:hypothetical protein
MVRFSTRLWEGDRGKDAHGHYALSRSVIRAGVFLFWRGGRFCFGGQQQPRGEGQPAVDNTSVAADVPCPYGFPGVSVGNGPAKGTGL